MMLTLRRLWIQLTADKRRFSALCVIMALGLLLWARLIVSAKIPRQAVAGDDNESAEAAGLPETPSDKRDLRPLQVILDEFPRRDPFLISDLHFPKPTTVTKLPADTPKPDPEPAEEGDQAAARLHAQLRAVVDRFDLRAVMTDGKGLPMAVINGRTYRLEDWIPAVGSEQVRFQLVEVRPRSVIMTCRDFRFELEIAPPGSQ